MITKEKKTNVINANATHENDTGSPEVQVAIWTSGEPVSFSWVALALMTLVFFSLVIMGKTPFLLSLYPMSEPREERTPRMAADPEAQNMGADFASLPLKRREVKK